jgi:hypothetical protein
VAYYSATFTPTEQNYDIYEREFLAVKKAIEHWRAYLIWTEHPFIIKMDHENLTYWKTPKKLMGRMARWHEKLQDYNFKITHILGKSNNPADALSRLEKEDEGEPELTSLIDPSAFINVFRSRRPGHSGMGSTGRTKPSASSHEQVSKGIPYHQDRHPTGRPVGRQRRTSSSATK